MTAVTVTIQLKGLFGDTLLEYLPPLNEMPQSNSTKYQTDYIMRHSHRRALTFYKCQQQNSCY